MKMDSAILPKRLTFTSTEQMQEHIWITKCRMNLLILTSASVVHYHNTEILSQESRANQVEWNLAF